MKSKPRQPNTTEDGELACAYGEPWMGPHPLCKARLERDCGPEISSAPLKQLTLNLEDQKNEASTRATRPRVPDRLRGVSDDSNGDSYASGAGADRRARAIDRHGLNY